MVQKDYNLDHSELAGMLIKNMDYKVYHPGNNLYETLATNNKFFKDTLIQSRDSRKNVSLNNLPSPRARTSSGDLKLTPSISKTSLDPRKVPSVSTFRNSNKSIFKSTKLPEKSEREVVKCLFTCLRS